MVADNNKTLKPGQTWSLHDATHVYCKKWKKKWPYNHKDRKSDAVRNHMNRFHQDVLMKYAEDEKQRTIRDGMKREMVLSIRHVVRMTAHRMVKQKGSSTS